MGHDLEVEVTIRVRAAAQLADPVARRITAALFEGTQPRLELLGCLDDVGPAVTNVFDGDQVIRQVTVSASRSMAKRSLGKRPSGAFGACTLVIGTAPISSRSARLAPEP
ncbi:MAG: hypothetical protein GEU71_13065 [Actinobacteria bacterium]|nr:hypothetical protein [Actinomycetota bacterium]